MTTEMTLEKLECNISAYIAAIADGVTNGGATAAIMADIRAAIAPAKADAERLRAALRGVIAVADRKTVEFDEARAALQGEQP